MKHLPSIFFIILVSLCLCSCNKLKVASLESSAILATSNGDLEKAEELYKKMIALDPQEPEHHWGLGTTYLSRRQNDKAAKEIKILRQMGREDLADKMVFLLNQPLEE
ncbi:MAG: tetratricopeptide repeat protein [Candidatus Omnitrophota bacterium]